MIVLVVLSHLNLIINEIQSKWILETTNFRLSVVWSNLMSIGYKSGVSFVAKVKDL